MSQHLKVITEQGDRYLEKLPDTCPFCHRSIRPNPIRGYIYRKEMEVFFSCPHDNCLKGFIGYYEFLPSASYQKFKGKTTQGVLTSRTFSDHINSISQDFSRIYNQAFTAEQQGLTEICGVGYRKALEFLLKDYAIINFPDKKEHIEKIQLAKVIGEFVHDSRIKSVSKRAVWLGNDETHYVRKWEGKNLEDLKRLIDLTLHWVEMEILTASFESEMPE